MLKKIFQKLFPSVRYGSRLTKSVDWLEDQQLRMNQAVRDLDEKQEYLFWLNQRREGETLSQTKARVFRDLPKAEGQMRDTQLVNLYILRELQKVCKANGLSVFLMWGTLLGAIRHGGFIPWDDDIDVGMLYSDYLRLKEVLRDHPELRMETCFNYNNNAHRVKVRLRNATPFFVDVFLFDFVEYDPAHPEQLQSRIPPMFDAYQSKMKELFCQQYDLNTKCPPFLTSAKIEKELEAYMNGVLASAPYYGKGEYITCAICGDQFLPWFLYHKDRAMPFQKILFESEECNCFSNADDILLQNYSDYWRFPSKISPLHSEETAFDSKEYQELIAEIKTKLQLT